MARTAPLPVRRTYNELDRWRAYNHYITSGQFTKTTAKACFIGVSTMRYWVKLWDFDEHGQARNPPDQPTADELEEIKDSGDLVVTYERLLRMSLARMEEVIPKTNSADQLGRVAKDMAERIDRAKGIIGGVPSTVNVNLKLAEAEKAGEKLLDLIGNTIASAREREAHIVDVEALELKELPNADEQGSDDSVPEEPQEGQIS